MNSGMPRERGDDVDQGVNGKPAAAAVFKVADAGLGLPAQVGCLVLCPAVGVDDLVDGFDQFSANLLACD